MQMEKENSEDPDQTAPKWPWSDCSSALFALTYLSENLGSYYTTFSLICFWVAIELNFFHADRENSDQTRLTGDLSLHQEHKLTCSGSF